MADDKDEELDVAPIRSYLRACYDSEQRKVMLFGQVHLLFQSRAVPDL